MNNRRKLVIALGAGALAVPFGSFAQQQRKVWRVGFIVPRRRPDSMDADFYGAFPRGMRDLGYIEGENLLIEWRFADSKFERLPSLAAELVRIKMDVIVTAGPQATSAAQKATSTIPIVMVNSNDPVGSGFVKSLAHPGGNITGLSNFNVDLGSKHFDLLLNMVPKLARVAVLANLSNSGHDKIVQNVQAAAQKTGVKVMTLEARTPPDIENAFALMIRENVGAVIVAPDAIFTQQTRQIAELTAKNRLPSIYPIRVYPEAGGLMSYGQNRADDYRLAATYVDKIFKGAKPSDLPVEQPTKFELVINGKIAKALGLTIPQALLISADKVIE
jgi:putative tryptophan/tyrosine transport system substrate-binding protein